MKKELTSSSNNSGLELQRWKDGDLKRQFEALYKYVDELHVQHQEDVNTTIKLPLIEIIESKCSKTNENLNKFISNNKAENRRMVERQDAKIKQVKRDLTSNTESAVQRLTNDIKHDMNYIKDDMSDAFAKQMNENASMYNHKIESIEHKIVDLEMKQISRGKPMYSSMKTSDDMRNDRAGDDSNRAIPAGTFDGGKYVTNSGLQMLLNKNNNTVVQMFDTKLNSKIQRSVIQMEQKMNHAIQNQINSNISSQIANNNHTYIEEELRNKLSILQTEIYQHVAQQLNDYKSLLEGDRNVVNTNNGKRFTSMDGKMKEFNSKIVNVKSYVDEKVNALLSSIEDARRESSSSLDEMRIHMNEQNSQWAQQYSRNQEQQQQQRQKERKASNEVYQGPSHA